MKLIILRSKKENYVSRSNIRRGNEAECDALVPCNSGSGDGGVKDTRGGTDRADREIIRMFLKGLGVGIVYG